MGAWDAFCEDEDESGGCGARGREAESNVGPPLDPSGKGFPVVPRSASCGDRSCGGADWKLENSVKSSSSSSTPLPCVAGAGAGWRLEPRELAGSPLTAVPPGETCWSAGRFPPFISSLRLSLDFGAAVGVADELAFCI